MSGIGGIGGAGRLPLDPAATTPATPGAGPVAAPAAPTAPSAPAAATVARPRPVAPAAAAGARAPVDPAVYGPILDEARRADWRGLGIDPVRYVDDRLDRERFLRPLLADPGAKVVLHRDALKVGEVGSIDGSRTRNVTHPDSKDFPGRVYLSPEDGAYHVVGILGEDWYRQTLHMLATAGVPASKVEVEGAFDPGRVVERDLGPTLAAHDFDAVTVGTMGELTKAMERALRERVRPAHVEKVLRDMAGHLEKQAAEARPDRRPAWEERRARLDAVRAQGGTAPERLERVKADPVLRGPLGELIRSADEGPPARELPWRWETRNAQALAHRVVEVDGRKHLLIHIGGAHGDMAYHAVRHVLAHEPDLRRVNVYGSAGSFTTRIPPDTFILPRGAIRSAESDRAPVAVRNEAALDGAIEVAHSNVSTLLREHRAGIARLTGLPADTVDIESYHVARAAAEAGRPVELRAILRVSDVATSDALGAHRPDRGTTSDYEARRAGEERAVVALGLVNP